MGPPALMPASCSLLPGFEYFAHICNILGHLKKINNHPSFDDEWPEMHLGISTGDPAAFRKLIAIYFPVLCSFADKFVHDPAQVKDIVQEVFIKLWSQRSDFSSGQAFKAYLYAAVRNGCLNAIRNRERLEARHNRAAEQIDEQVDGMEQILHSIVESEYLALIYRAVREMPEKMQQIFYLSYKDGLTVKQISLQLHMNLKAVKRQKYRALVALRKKLGGQSGALWLAIGLMEHIRP